MRRMAWLLLWGVCLVSWNGCEDPKTGEDPQMTDKPTSSSMLVPMEAESGGTDKSASASGSVLEPAVLDPSVPEPTTRPLPPVSSAAPLPRSRYSPPAPTQARVHVVQAKESLYSIARRYYSDEKQWRRVYHANRNRIKDPNRIKVGMKLIIP